MKKKQIKKFETGTFGVANNNNQAATERKLHQQNGTWSNLSAIPLIGKPLANGMNFMQGWGKAQYDRNESIANMKMDRLAGQAGAMQQSFSGQGMRNSISNTQFGNQDENDLYSTVNNKAKKGKNQMKDKALIEVEKDEFIFRPKGKGYKLVGDMKGGKTHEQGGEPVVAKEGDVIFPAKDRKLIAPLIGPGGSVRDLKRFEALRSRLPEDKPSDVRKGQMEAKASPNGAILGTGMNLTEGFREGTYEKYGQGQHSVRTGNQLKQQQAQAEKDAAARTKQTGKQYVAIKNPKGGYRIVLATSTGNNTSTINTPPPPSPSTSGRGPRTGTTTGNPGPTITRPSSGAPVPPPPIKATGRFTNSSPGSKSFKAPTQGSIFYDTEMGGARFKIDPLTNERVYLGEFYDENTKKNLKGGAKKAGEREPLRSNSKALVQRREIESKNAKTFPLSKHNVVAPEVSKTQKLLDKFVPKTKLGKIGMLTALGGLASETYNILNSDDTPIEKTKKVATKVGEAVTSAAMPGDSGVVDVKIDSLRRRLATVQKDSILHKDDPKSLAQLGREADTLIKQIKALGGDTSSTIQHSGRTQSVIDSLQTTPSDTTKTPTPKTEPETKTPATQSNSNSSSSPSSSSTPTPSRPRYSKLHTTGVERGGVQLEPTDAENKKYNPDDRRYDDEYSPEGVRTKKGKGANAGNYDDFKVSKIKEIREAGHDISEYEGANDIETFYNLYNDRKVNKPKSKEDKLLQEALREEEGNKPSITKPKPMEVDENSKPPKIYQDEELPEWNPKKRIPEGKQYDSRKDKPGVTQKLPDRVEIERSETPKEYFERRTREDRNNAKKLKHGSKSLKEYSKGSYSVKHGVEHEQRELRNFDDIQKELNGLKRMHKGIPKAEQGMQSVFGVNTGVRQQDPPNNTASGPNMYVPAGVGSNAQGTLQPSSQPPVNKRPMTPMQGIAPMPVNAGNNANLWAHTSRPAYNDPNARLKQMTERDTTITPTMPTLEFPKETLGQKAKNAIRKGAKGGWGISGFDTAGFNQAVGLSRQRGDRYTDKYTDVAGGGRVNQYNKGVSSMKTCEDGSKKLKLRKYGWGTAFMETNKGETKKEREERKQLERDYYNSSLSSMKVFGDTIDRSIKMKEDLDKREGKKYSHGSSGLRKYESGSQGIFYRTARPHASDGKNKYNKQMVEDAIEKYGSNYSDEEKKYIRDFYKKRGVITGPGKDVNHPYDKDEYTTNSSQDPSRLIEMYRYAGKQFGDFEGYKKQFKKQKGVDLPYKTREEFVEDYVDNYGDKEHALHNSRKKAEFAHLNDDKNLTDSDFLSWKLGNIINENKVTASPTEREFVPGAERTTEKVLPTATTTETTKLQKVLTPAEVKEQQRIDMESKRRATGNTRGGNVTVGGLGGGEMEVDNKTRGGHNKASGTNRERYFGGGDGTGAGGSGGGPSVDAGSSRFAGGDTTGGNRTVGGMGQLVPKIGKNGEVTFEKNKPGKMKVDNSTEGGHNDASGDNAQRVDMRGGRGGLFGRRGGRGGALGNTPGDPNTPVDPNAPISTTPEGIRASQRAYKAENEAANADAQAKLEAAAKTNSDSAAALERMKAEAPANAAAQVAANDAAFEKASAAHKAAEDDKRKKAVEQMIAGGSTPEQAALDYDKAAPFKPMQKGDFKAGGLTGVDETDAAIKAAQAAQAGKAAPPAAASAPEAEYKSPGEIEAEKKAAAKAAEEKAFMAGEGGGEEAPLGDVNTSQISAPTAIGGSVDKSKLDARHKYGKTVIRGGSRPGDAELLAKIQEERTKRYEAGQKANSDRSLDKRGAEKARYERDARIVESQGRAGGSVIQGRGNNNNPTTQTTEVTTPPAETTTPPVTTPTDAATPEEKKLKRGTKKLVLRKYESGEKKLEKDDTNTSQQERAVGIGTNTDESDEKTGYEEGKIVINNRQANRLDARTARKKARLDAKVEKAKIKSEKVSKAGSSDFNMPKWKTPREKNDPMVSPDDTTALKVSLNRNNYQDSSAPQRQEISSLMSGGGFDSSNQIANKINKEKALSKVNADEQNRLSQVNQSNTAILNEEKVMNMKNMAQAIDEKAQNKGVADATNYNAVLRNNQRFNDKPMKDLNYNMARGQYAMMGPMMNLQMQQAQMANEYMKDGMKTPTPPTPTPSPAPTPTNPGAGWNANPASINSNTPTTGMGPNPAATAGGPPAANVTSNNFLQQMGFVNPRKGIKKLKLSKNSLIAKTVKK